MKTLSINSKVRIKLTPFGIAKLNAKHERLCALCPFIGKFTLPSIDKDGYCEMQLWEIMNMFGDDIYPGNINIPFEDTILIDNAYLKESAD